MKVPLTEVQEDLKKLRDIRYWVRNALDFLPLDRSGNRRFIPVMVYPEQAEVHILEDEAASRAYIEQMWAEAMEIYRSGRFKLLSAPPCSGISKNTSGILCRRTPKPE